MAAAMRRNRRMTREELKQANVDWKMVRGIFELARPWRGSLVLFGVCAIAAAVIGTAPAVLYGRIVDNLVRDQSVSRLVTLAGATLGLHVLRSLIVVLQRWASSRVGSGITYTMRVRLFDHIQRMPASFFTATQTGALMSRINNDVMGAQRVLTEIVSTLTTNAFTFISTVGVMLALDWQLTLVVLAAVPAFLLPAKYMARVMQKMTRQRMDLMADMNGFLHERLNVSGATLNHLFGKPEAEQGEYEKRSGAIRDLGVRTALVAGVFGLATQLFSTTSIAMVYWVGGWRAITGGITVGVIVTFGALAQRAYTPVNQLTNVRIDLATALVSFERVFEVLNFQNAVMEKPDAIPLASPKGRIEFDHVAFAYPAPGAATLPSLENPMLAALRERLVGEGVDPTPAHVLHDVHFTAEPGQMVALVGPTGAGKSTTLNLVSRLADVTGGAVRVDGIDVRDLTLKSLRSAIGVVSQDTYLFHDTLRVNLLYAKPDATEAELAEACRLARIYDLIESLPEGFDTVAGERGYRMSGGEKQRLAIARMILKDPKIVVLDEATSHLDSENERLIQEALKEALAGRTTLVIAHRLSTIVEADQIVVIDAGRVVQTGTHDELVGVPGLYQTLHSTQFAAARPAERRGPAGRPASRAALRERYRTRVVSVDESIA